jgi:hypothetical protein
VVNIRRSEEAFARRTRSYTPYSEAIDGDTENDDDYVKTHPTHNDAGEKRTKEAARGDEGSRDTNTDIVQVQAGLTEAGNCQGRTATSASRETTTVRTVVSGCWNQNEETNRGERKS